MNKIERVRCFDMVLDYVLCLFLESALILNAWNMVAVAKFNAPAFTYWEVFWTSFAIRMLFSSNMIVNNK